MKGFAGLAGAMLFVLCPLTCQQVAAQSKDAEPATRASNETFAKSLPLADRADFDDYNGGWSSVMRSLRAHAEAGAFRTNRDIAIEVESLADAEAFYGGTLGFSVRARSADQLHLDAGSFTLWVNRVASRDDRRPCIPSLDVPSAVKARAALEDAGCRVVRDGTHGFYIEDPFGFTIDVIERDA